MSLYNVLQERITSPTFNVDRVEKESTHARYRLANLCGPRGKVRVNPKEAASRKRKSSFSPGHKAQVPLSEEQVAANRKVKADVVRVKATNLCNKFRRLILGGGFSYYLHSLEHHLADHIEACPIDIFDCSGSGVEKLNQHTKRIFRC